MSKLIHENKASRNQNCLNMKLSSVVEIDVDPEEYQMCEQPITSELPF